MSVGNFVFETIATINFTEVLFYFPVGLIHGDFDQFERNDVLKRFKANEFSILVATDVAGKIIRAGCKSEIIRLKSDQFSSDYSFVLSFPSVLSLMIYPFK